MQTLSQLWSKIPTEPFFSHIQWKRVELCCDWLKSEKIWGLCYLKHGKHCVHFALFHTNQFTNEEKCLHIAVFTYMAKVFLLCIMDNELIKFALLSF